MCQITIIKAFSPVREVSMAHTTYFSEVIVDQGGKDKMNIEIGRSSFYAGCPLPEGTGEDSIFITVDDKHVVMDLATAKRFVDAVMSVGIYHKLC
jgi:hypothetical protein